MKKEYWKIKNVTAKPVNFVAAMPSCGSKGVLLQPGETIITEVVKVNGTPVKTAILGFQERRRIVEIDYNFNNDLYNLTTNVNLKTATVEDKIKFTDAEKNAEGYMKS